jgi:hypothetical protein
VVGRVDVGRDQLGGHRIGTGNDDGGNAHDIGGQPGGIERPDVLRCRHEHLAAEMAALLLRR